MDPSETAAAIAPLIEIPWHNIDPVALDFGLQVRWYGLGYLVSFLIAMVALGRAQRRGELRLRPDDVSSFIIYAIVGTFLGGRLGYLLFYDDYFYSGRVFRQPLEFFGLQSTGFEGISGLAFHGGLTGVVIAVALFCYTRVRRELRLGGGILATPGQDWLPLASSGGVGGGAVSATESAGEATVPPPESRIPEAESPDGPERSEGSSDDSGTRRARDSDPDALWPRFRGVVANCFDTAVMVVPFGIFLVRLANFINGELYGRQILGADGLPVVDADNAPAWAMRFPTSPEGREALYRYYLNWMIENDTTSSAQRAGLSALDWYRPQADAMARKLPVDPDAWGAVKDSVTLRHPSQIYQGLLEGLLVLVAVWIVRTKVRKSGVMAGTFLLGYALCRIPAELFRQPDRQFADGQKLEGWGQFLASIGLTQGQFLSLLMGIAGLAMIILCARSRNPWMLRRFTGA